jgi:diguanylate cyclase (GGDEF)-like protein
MGDARSGARTVAKFSRTPAIVSATIVVATAAIATLGQRQLTATGSFMPALLAVVACFDLLSVYLLMGEYRDTGDRRLLAMCVAYVWSLVLMGGYALAFPGVVSAHPPLAITPSVAPWLYIGWHGGFPLVLGAAWAPWPQRLMRANSADIRRRNGLAAVAVVTALAATLVALCAGFARRLPVLIHGHDVGRMTQLTAPVVLPLVLLAFVSAWAGTRQRSGPERWTSVAVLVCLCDLVLTYASRYRFSVGWYAGRVMTGIAAAVVLIAMLSEFRRLKSRAERNAAYDSLTGLANHRHTYDTLGRAFSTARRAHAPLAVVSLDLDLFKQVNDQYGHGAGDQLLTAVGTALAAAVRTSDLVGRVGGEEFLAILPDTEAQGALIVAERMRAAVAATYVAAAGGVCSASAGVAQLHPADSEPAALLRRVDTALYHAKKSGRNRIELARAETHDGNPIHPRPDSIPQKAGPHSAREEFGLATT